MHWKQYLPLNVVFILIRFLGLEIKEVENVMVCNGISVHSLFDDTRIRCRVKCFAHTLKVTMGHCMCFGYVLDRHMIPHGHIMQGALVCEVHGGIPLVSSPSHIYKGPFTMPTRSEEREVLGVGSIPVAILPSCQGMKTTAL